MLIVNVVDTGSNDAAQNIINLAKAKNVPVIFFNRSVDQSVIESYENEINKAITDQKYGEGASDYIADALRYYFHK